MTLGKDTEIRNCGELTYAETCPTFRSARADDASGGGKLTWVTQIIYPAPAGKP
jgi:hypothetical protein